MEFQLELLRQLNKRTRNARWQVVRDRGLLVRYECAPGLLGIDDAVIEDSLQYGDTGIMVFNQCLEMFRGHHTFRTMDFERAMPHVTCPNCKHDVELVDFSAMTRGQKHEECERQSVLWAEHALRAR